MRDTQKVGKMRIKIFGERNTSTRALTQLLRDNSRSNFLPGTMKELSPITAKTVSLLQKLGIPDKRREAIIDRVFEKRHPLEQWKHTATHFEVDSSLDGVHFVFAVRDPRSWLIGFFKRPYHILVDKPATLTEFADLEWQVVARDRLPERAYCPLELYACKLQSYLEFMNALERENRSYSVVKFEDFVTGQRNVFDALRPYLSSPADTFAELTKSTKDATKDASYYADYYAKERWRNDFPEIDAVTLPDNSTVFQAFGYSL